MVSVAGSLGGGIGFPFRRKGLAQRFASARQERASCDVAHTECGRELKTGEVVQFSEEERGSLSLGDLRECPLEVTRQPRIHDEMLRGWCRAARFAGPRQEADDLASP